MFVHPMAQYWVSGGFAALCVLIAARMKETLAPEQRRPFRWSGANPLSNVLLLMRNGPGLRRLTISATLLMIRNTHWSIVGAYRFGSLGPPLSPLSPPPALPPSLPPSAASAISRRSLLCSTARRLPLRILYDCSLSADLRNRLLRAGWSPEVNARFGMIIQPTHGIIGGLVTVPFLSRKIVILSRFVHCPSREP